MEPEGPSRLLLPPHDVQSQQRHPASFLGSGPRRPPPAELPPKPCSVYPGCSPTTDSLSIWIFQSYSDKLLQTAVAPNNSFLSHSSAGQKSRIKMSAPHRPCRKLFHQHSFLLLCGSSHSRACGRLSAISPLGLSVSEYPSPFYLYLNFFFFFKL